jgi:hypothetical protein
MAGHPIWKTRSEYPDRLGISRGHIHCLMCYYHDELQRQHRLLRLARILSFSVPRLAKGCACQCHVQHVIFVGRILMLQMWHQQWEKRAGWQLDYLEAIYSNKNAPKATQHHPVTNDCLYHVHAVHIHR